MKGISEFLEACAAGKKSVHLQIVELKVLNGFITIICTCILCCHFLKVDKQVSSVDCGVHVIHNMDLLAKVRECPHVHI